MALRSRSPQRGRSAVRLHDQAELIFSAERPVALQLDGEYVGERESVSFRAVRKALRVVA